MIDKFVGIMCAIGTSILVLWTIVITWYYIDKLFL